MNASHELSFHLIPLFRAVLASSWQGTLAIVLVLLVRWALGTRVPARWHHVLWFLVIARLLVPAFLLPHSPGSLENIPAVAHPLQSLSPVVREGAPTGSVMVVPAPRAAVPPSFRPPLMQTRPAATMRSSHYPNLGWWCAAGVWLGGACLLGGWFVACTLRLRRRLRRDVHPVDEATLSLWQTSCRRWLGRTPPRLLAADWVNSPALVGLFRPVLLIPRYTLADFSTQDWEHVFIHEVAHLRCRDHWSQFLQLLALCVHWFNPLVWLGFRRLRADRELAADEWALRHLEGGRALAYGETLFKTLAACPAPFSFQPGMVGISEDGAQMKRRLRHITAFLPRRRVCGSLAGFAAVLVLGTVVLGQGLSDPGNPTGNVVVKLPGTRAAAPPSDADVQRIAEKILAAARAGDARKVSDLLDASTSGGPSLGPANAAVMLSDLIFRREYAPFAVLLEQLLQTNLGKSWNLSDALLAALVEEERKDFLDELLHTKRLDLDRLKACVNSATQPMAGWITQRTVELARQRTDIEALELAADRADLPAMERLLAAGADANGVGRDDNTPLLRAVFKDRLDAAQWLLDHGAQVDKPRLPGWDYTPLCLVGSAPMADLLLKHGANLRAKLWHRDVSILVYAAEFGKAEVVEWFLRQGLDPKMNGDHHQNLLFGLKDPQTAGLLLKAGVDPNQVDDFGLTPICTACSGGVARQLIDHGARLDGFDAPLLTVMVNNSATGDAIEAAIKAGAKHDPATLHDAVINAQRMYNAKNIVPVLVKYGAKPERLEEVKSGESDVDYSASVSTADGSLIDYKSVMVHHYEVTGPDSTMSSGEKVDYEGKINLRMAADSLSATYAVTKDGYATIYAGPFTPPTGEKFKGTRFVLDKGFTASVQMVDENGKPISEAKVKAYYPGPPPLDLAQVSTSAVGEAVFDHIGTAPLNVRATADGYQADEVTGIHLDAGKPCRWTLRKARPLSGTVTSRDSGQPVSGAIIKLAGVRGPHEETYGSPVAAPVLATTDVQGRFALTSLRADSRYFLYVEAADHGGVFLGEIKCGPGELKVVLGPALFVRGKVIHSPRGPLPGGALLASYYQNFKIGDGYHSAVQGLTVQPKDGQGNFEVAALYDLPVDIQIDEKRFRYGAQELPKSDVVVDLALEAGGQPSDPPTAAAGTPTPNPTVISTP